MLAAKQIAVEARGLLFLPPDPCHLRIAFDIAAARF
jgi:hypothetical protein